MFQRYFVGDVLIHREDKTLVKVVREIKGLDQLPYYNYEIEIEGSNRNGVVHQFLLENRYISKKEIDSEILQNEHDKNMAEQRIIELQLLRAEMMVKLRQEKDSKR